MTTYDILTADAELELAHAIEAGILAASLCPEAHLDASATELAQLVELGRLAEEALLFAHRGLVRHAVRMELRSLGARDDVTQEAWLALAEAVRRFDHRKGRFVTYATPALRAAVRAAVARELGLSERQARGLRAIRGAEATLTAAWSRTPSPADVARHLDKDVSWVTWCSRQGVLTEPIELEALSDIRQAVADDDRAERSEVRGLALRALRRLPEPQRTVVAARHPMRGAAASYDELAARLQLSISTVRRLEQRGLRLLRHALSDQVAA